MIEVFFNVQVSGNEHRYKRVKVVSRIFFYILFGFPSYILNTLSFP